MARDIILSAFATPGSANLRGAGLSSWSPSDVQPLGKFRDRPLLLDVPKTGAPGQAPEAWGGKPFKRTAAKLKAAGQGSIIRGMLKRYAADVQPRRIALIAFSAGNSFLNQVLQSEIDAELLDTVISLDGMVYGKNGGAYIPASFEGYVNFAKRATGLLHQREGVSNPYLSPLFVNAHTHIASNSDFASSTDEAAEKLFWLVNNRYWQAAKRVPSSVKQDQGRRQQQIIQRLRSSFSRMTPVTVDCNGPKTYRNLDPSLGYLGNLWSLDFGGTQGADHCMVAYVAQRAIFDAYLIPRWNARDEAVAGLSGLGSQELMVQSDGVTWTSPYPRQPGGGIVRRDVLSASPLAIAGKYAAGTAAAYVAFELGRRLMTR
jgi:hypothetical protein